MLILKIKVFKLYMLCHSTGLNKLEIKFILHFGFVNSCIYITNSKKTVFMITPSHLLGLILINQLKNQLIFYF